jgi:CheY-like chemotaxis protein
MKLLFADDLKDTRDLYKYVLEALYGFSVETAADGKCAIQAVLESPEPFDGIVLDIEMPVFDGWKVLEAIRQLPAYKDVPVILFTAYADSSISRRAEREGATLLLHKPMLPHIFGHAIHKAIEEHRTQSQALEALCDNPSVPN